MIDEIERQKKEKQQAEEKRARLLLGLSHDIRTPVAKVKSIATALREDLVPEKERERYYEIIRAKADRIGDLSESLFTLLKMEDAQAPTGVGTDVAELLREVCGAYYHEIEERGLRLEAAIPEREIRLMLDPQLISRAVGNLIENAIRYNETGDEIRVSIQTEENAVRIFVFDDGTSIPAPERPQLFDAFTRGDRSRATDGGTGLGLSIAKTIVQKHGGTLGYTADAGNCFTITLPLNQ